MTWKSHHITVYFRQLGPYKQRQTDRQTDRVHKLHKNRDTQNTHTEQTEGHAEANTDKHRIKWWEILFKTRQDTFKRRRVS